MRASGFGRATPAAMVGDAEAPAAPAAPAAADPAATPRAAPAPPAAASPAVPAAPASPAAPAPAASRAPAPLRSSPRNDSSASAISAAVVKRSSGVGASALRQIDSRV